MDQDLREVVIRAFSHKVNTCIKRINEFIGKLDSVNERMSLEGMDDHEQLILSDSSVIETVCIMYDFVRLTKSCRLNRP